MEYRYLIKESCFLVYCGERFGSVGHDNIIIETKHER